MAVKDEGGISSCDKIMKKKRKKCRKKQFGKVDNKYEYIHNLEVVYTAWMYCEDLESPNEKKLTLNITRYSHVILYMGLYTPTLVTSFSIGFMAYVIQI